MEVNREKLEYLIMRAINSDQSEDTSDLTNQSIESFMLIKLLVIIEDEFGLEIDLDFLAIENVENIREFITVVFEYLQKQ